MFTCVFAGCKKQSVDKEESSTSTTVQESSETVSDVIEESSEVSDTESSTDESSSTDVASTTASNDDKPPLTSSTADKNAAQGFFGDVAFIGDSISVGLRLRATSTKRLPGATFLARESYSSYHAVNGSMLLTYRGQKMSPENAVKASGCKKVFIMLGMNDLNMYSTLDGCIRSMQTMISRIKSKNPGVKIYIQSMTPIVIGSEKGRLNNKNIDQYNVMLKSLAASVGAVYIDVATPLKNSANGLNPKYSSDQYVHLNNTGLDIWISALEKFAASQTPVVQPTETTTKPVESTTKPVETTTKPVETTTKPIETTTTKPAETTTAATTTTTTTTTTTQPEIPATTAGFDEE